jgi:hypothetical protein
MCTRCRVDVDAFVDHAIAWSVGAGCAGSLVVGAVVWHAPKPVAARRTRERADNERTISASS